MAAGDAFISYRRADTRWPAAALYDRLAARLGGDRVFKDIDDIEPGEDFVATLDEAVSRSAVVLVLMGDRWLDAADEHGNRRLDDPADFVRIEIATALRRGIRVIPVLVDAAEMPRGSDLPPEIAPLARMQAVQISAERMDVSRLLRVIEPILERAELTAPPVVVWDTEFVPREREPTAPVPEPGPDPQDVQLVAAPVTNAAASEATTTHRLSASTARHRRVLIVMLAGAAAAVVVTLLSLLNWYPVAPAFGVADEVGHLEVDPLTGSLYVTGSTTSANAEDKLFVVDLDTQAASPTVPIPSPAVAVAVDPQRNRAIVAGNDLLVVDTAAATAALSVSLEAGWGLAVDSVTGLAYVAESGGGVAVVDPATGAVEARIPTDGGPYGLAIDSAARRLYLSDGGRLVIIDLDTNGVTDTVLMGGVRWVRALDTANGRLYLSMVPGGVSVFDISSRSLMDVQGLSGWVADIAFDQGVDRAFAVHQPWDLLGRSAVSVIDGARLVVTTTVRVGANGSDIAVDPASHRAYVANRSDGTISVIAP